MGHLDTIELLPLKVRCDFAIEAVAVLSADEALSLPIVYTGHRTITKRTCLTAEWVDCKAPSIPEGPAKRYPTRLKELRVIRVGKAGGERLRSWTAAGHQYKEKQEGCGWTWGTPGLWMVAIRWR